MHSRYEQAARITGEIIAAAIEVHRVMGPGLVESIYEWCLTKELELRGLLVNDVLLIETKAVEKIHPIHKAMLLTYMRLLDVPLGLIINFHQEKLTDGVARLILPGADN
jgi:hypothetical protein